MSFWHRILGKEESKATPASSTEQCPDCDDVGISKTKGNGLCSNCHGAGTVIGNSVELQQKCQDCAGSGKCQTCKGSGYVKPGFRQTTEGIPTLRDSAQDEESAQALEAVFEILLHKGDADKVKQVEALLTANPMLLSLRNKAGSTALHAAAIANCVDVVQLLISKGADVNIKSRDGYTPLHMVSMMGPTSIVETLLSSGADVNAKTTDGKTPLSLTYSESVAALLRDHGGKK
jgi:RecJ-like exonuclease